MHLRAGPHRRSSVWPVGLLALLVLLFAGCGEETSTPTAPTFAPAAETQSDAPPQSLPPLAPELVGTWSVSDTSGPQQISQTYVFSPDGRYDYQLGTCQGSSCSIVYQESGLAGGGGGVVSLVPQTESDEGPRNLPYAIVQDPVVGDITLQLTLPDGTIAILYPG